MNHLVRSALNGAFAGGVATTLMTGVMKLGQSAGLYQDEIPPVAITQNALDTAGLSQKVGDGEETALAGVSHWAFGMIAGALFGALHRLLRVPLAAPVHGTIFGLLVWLVSYAGWIPALRLFPAPWNQRPREALMPVVAHVVYGAALGATFGVMEHRD